MHLSMFGSEEGCHGGGVYSFFPQEFAILLTYQSGQSSCTINSDYSPQRPDCASRSTLGP